MKSRPLFQHYFQQIEALRRAESALIGFIAWLYRSLPGAGLNSALADMETCSSGRLDCLQSLLHRHRDIVGSRQPHGGSAPFPKAGMDEIARAQGTAVRQALALRICVELDRQLIHGYRVAKVVAEKLGFAADARRFETLIGTLADRNLCWKPASSPGEEHSDHLELVSR